MVGRSSTPIVATSSIQLPEDVIHDILLRVPAKPLRRLRAVCRSWRSLTSTSSFIAAHTARHGPLVAAGHRLWFLTDGEEKGLWAKRYTISLLVANFGCSRPFDGSTRGHPLCMLGDGRIVFSEWQSSWEDEEWDFELLRVYDPRTSTCTDGVKMVDYSIMAWEKDDRRLRALDPATGAVSLLPRCGTRIPHVDHRITLFALRRASSTGDTKVLGITEGLYSCTNSPKAAWSSPSAIPAALRYVALANGVLYFWRYDVIVAYDLGREKWRPDILGTLPSIAGKKVELAELRDSLVAAAYYPNHDGGLATSPSAFPDSLTVAHGYSSTEDRASAAAETQTTAETWTSGGPIVRVSFEVADPPGEGRGEHSILEKPHCLTKQAKQIMLQEAVISELMAAMKELVAGQGTLVAGQERLVAESMTLRDTVME
ncbi:hypothetical protein BRADI_1g54256v3, partial [Brachypodium distachyon]